MAHRAEHTVQIDNSQISPGSDERLRHHQPQPTGTAGDNGDSVLQRELGQSPLESHTLEGRRVRHLALIGVFPLDILIRLGVGLPTAAVEGLGDGWVRHFGCWRVKLCVNIKYN